MTPRHARLLLALLVLCLAARALAASPAGSESRGAPINPLNYDGADIGAKVNAAFAAMPEHRGTVRIPSGNYEFATTIKIAHFGEHLICDSGALLRYTGSEDAILVPPDPASGGSQELSIDGEGGCRLYGNPRARNGIELMPSNTTVVRNMRIFDFSRGNAIELSGANNVQILSNAIKGNLHGIDMTTVPHFAPNAVHVAYNEVADNQWGVYCHDGHVVASRGLGNVYRDNVFEGNKQGDLMLGWDAHTLVEGNYFESTGVAVAAGANGANVLDIHIIRNYFTTMGYRSEIELGYGFGFFIEGNYEEGSTAPTSGCAVNAIPGPHGGIQGVVLQNAFSAFSESARSAHELCYKGGPTIPPGVLGTTRIYGDISVLDGSLKLDHGAVTSTNAMIHAGDACRPEGTLTISSPAGHAAQLLFCSGGHWQAVAGAR